MATAIFYPPAYALYTLRLVDLQELFTSTVLHLNLSWCAIFSLETGVVLCWVCVEFSPWSFVTIPKFSIRLFADDIILIINDKNLENLNKTANLELEKCNVDFHPMHFL